MEEEERSVFATLSLVDVSGRTEQKGQLTYLSWAWAWYEVKKRYPDAQSKVYEREDGRIYWDDGRTCWVKVSVTIRGLEHIEYLPVMDYNNRSIPLDKVTSTDVNKAIQRGVTKAIARHGLGLYIYAGEDLPEGMDTAAVEAKRRIVEDKCRELRLNIEAWCRTTGCSWADVQDETKLDAMIAAIEEREKKQ